MYVKEGGYIKDVDYDSRRPMIVSANHLSKPIVKAADVKMLRLFVQRFAFCDLEIK